MQYEDYLTDAVQLTFDFGVSDEDISQVVCNRAKLLAGIPSEENPVEYPETY